MPSHKKFLPMKIRCQRPHDNRSGCDVCGGANYVLESMVVCHCGQTAWVMPKRRNVTLYDGKLEVSFDGVEFVYHADKKTTCLSCEQNGIRG